MQKHQLTKFGGGFIFLSRKTYSMRQNKARGEDRTRTELDQTGPDWTGPDRTGPDRTGPDRTSHH